MVHSVFVYLGTSGRHCWSFPCSSQRYWFARAWRFAGRINSPAWRKAMRGALLAVVAGIAVAALAAVLRNMLGVVSRGSWWTAFFRFCG